MGLHVKYPLFLSDFLNISYKISHISNFMNIRPEGAELFHSCVRAGVRTYRHGATNSRFLQFCERAYKWISNDAPLHTSLSLRRT